jgi:uncharacterized Fe-S center protein
MAKTSVYWSDARAPPSYVEKGQKLFEDAGLMDCFRNGDSVAIKAHCGDWNNTGYLRPNIVAGIVESVKEYGGDPFVCDTTTLYWRTRITMQDLLKTAARNGYTEASLGCPFIVADGDIGLDDVKVSVDGNFFRSTYIARAIADADALIALSHFKGHGMGSYGGAIKNLGIGCCSKRGKIVTHLMLHPTMGLGTWKFNPEKCIGKDCPVYQRCNEDCPVEAFWLTEDKPHAHRDLEKCIGCIDCGIRRGCGVLVRPAGYEQIYPAAFADSAKAVVNILGREHVGYITYAIDISPECDCAGYSDTWILPNFGVFASKDMVAIDKACLDMSDKSEGVAGSALYDEGRPETPWMTGHEKFTNVHDTVISQWSQINAAVRIGCGSIDYELVEATPAPPMRYTMPKFRDHYPGYRDRRKFRLESLRPDPSCYIEKPKMTLSELTRKP